MISELLGYTGTQIATICIEVANIGLLSGLLYLYIKSYRQIKVGFTIGLVLFALFLLLKSITTLGLLVVDVDTFTHSRPVFVGGIIEFIALAILLKITWDY